jgi:excisionase family DNA binding protein
MDVSDVARLLRVSERTVRRWLRDGRLAGYKVGGRVRIPERAVREAATGYGTDAASADEAAGRPAGRPADPVVAWLTSPERLRERRERAARVMDGIRATTKPPGGPDDTVEAYIREMRAEQDAKADRILGLDHA